MSWIRYDKSVCKKGPINRIQEQKDSQKNICRQSDIQYDLETKRHLTPWELLTPPRCSDVMERSTDEPDLLTFHVIKYWLSSLSWKQSSNRCTEKPRYLLEWKKREWASLNWRLWWTHFFKFEAVTMDVHLRTRLLIRYGIQKLPTKVDEQVEKNRF